MFEDMGFDGIFDFGADHLEKLGYSDNFVRFLWLYLEEPGKENVLKAVKMLEQLEYVLTASPYGSDIVPQYTNRRVFASLDSDAASDIGSDIVYTLSLNHAKGLLSIELEFEIDGNLLVFNRIEGLSGFEPNDGVMWQNIGDGIWKGQVTLVNTQEEKPQNLMSMLGLLDFDDYVKFIYSPCNQGNATMKLTDIKAFGYNVYWDFAPLYRDTCIVKDEASTAIQQLVWSKYDLNKDNTTDSLDLGMMLLYCGSDNDSANWDELVKVNDSRGNGVTASMCDVNGDGLIDMLDLIDMFIHYTK